MSIIQTLEEVEREHILTVLRALDGHRSDAAQALGINLRTLRYRISKYRAAGYVIPEAPAQGDRSGPLPPVTLLCTYCDEPFVKKASVVNFLRKRGQKHFFCCTEHASTFFWELKNKKERENDEA